MGESAIRFYHSMQRSYVTAEECRNVAWSFEWLDWFKRMQRLKSLCAWHEIRSVVVFHMCTFCCSCSMCSWNWPLKILGLNKFLARILENQLGGPWVCVCACNPFCSRPENKISLHSNFLSIYLAVFLGLCLGAFYIIKLLWRWKKS